MDLSAQTSNLALGQCHPAVVAAASQQLAQLVYASSSFSSASFRDLSDRLVDLAPEGIAAAHIRLCDGSDAVETACKMARLYRWNTRLLAVRDSWHGETTATLAFSGAHKDTPLVAEQVNELSARPTLGSLADLIASSPAVAGVVVDPVGVSSGLFAADDIAQNLPRIRHLCSERDIVLIFDEVQTFGFMGQHLFACEAFGVTPDIVCVAKALGGGLPLAGLLCRAELADLLSHNDAEFTNGGNPVSCAAGLAFLETYSAERERIGQGADAFGEATSELGRRFPELEVRQYGFIATFQGRQDRFREAWAGGVVSEALRRDIILRATNFGQSVMVKPSILIDPETVESLPDLLAPIFESASAGIADGGVSMAGLRAGLGAGYEDGDAGLGAGDGDGDAGLGAGDGDGDAGLGAGDGDGDAAAALEARLEASVEALDPSCQVRRRTPEEVERLCGRLPRLGVRVSRAFATGDGSVEYDPVRGTGLKEVLRSTVGDAPPSVERTVNGLVATYGRALSSAHANAIVLGDRRVESAVVSSDGSLVLIGLDRCYEGPIELVTLYERMFALCDFLVHVPQSRVRAAVFARMVEPLFEADRRSAARCWAAMRETHLGRVAALVAAGHGTETPDDVVRWGDDVALGAAG